MAGLTPAAPAPISPTPTVIVSLALPDAFHYEVTLRPIGSSEAYQIVTSGQYRAGDWMQEVNNGAGLAEEAIVVEGATYTRPAGETTWTRWPGISFDMAYGLVSPFTPLRLYPLAETRTKPVLEPVAGAPEATFRVQTVVSALAIKQLLATGAAAVTADPASRAALEAQAAPMAVQQTVTYWVGEDNRIYRAAATLLIKDESGQPTPWLGVTWRFWGYDDASIAIAAPASFRTAPGPMATSLPLPTPLPRQLTATEGTLLVRVFAAPGILADNLSVTVYSAGEVRQPVDWRNQPEVQFILPPGRYDVLVQMDYAEQWIRDLEVVAGQALTQEVVFDFGFLQLTVTRNGVTVPVDIVTYPTGERQNWVDWRSDNPATIRLRAGTYDAEIAYDNYTKTKVVTGLQVRAGETTVQNVELEQ